MTCISCKNVSSCVEENTLLHDVGCAGVDNIVDALGQYFGAAVVESRCPKCSVNNNNVSKTSEYILGSTPRYFIVCLQRFERFNGLAQKDCRRMKVTSEFSLMSTTYRLCGAILHHGATMQSGHYTCLFKQECGGSTWIHYNDDKVCLCLTPQLYH